MTSPTYEVELKFPVSDPAPVVARLIARGAARGETLSQCDVYFNHPARDFAQSDEALRIRSVGGRHRVTYKGPLVDEVTKTRREIELPIGETGADGERFAEVLALLGFRRTREVRKTRTPYHIIWDGRPVEICLDEVQGLGTFVELESAAGDEDLDAARESLLTLSAELGLENSERRSYLTLLLERDAAS